MPVTESVKHILGFPFRDARWQHKFLIGALLCLGNFIVPILPAIVMLGYVSRIIERVVTGDGEFQLPEWDDLGRLFGDGLRLFGASLIYSLPMTFLVMIAMGVMFAPVVFLPFMENNSSDGIFAALMMLGQFAFLAIFGVAMFVGIILYILSPAMLVHTAVRQKFSAAFEIGSWFNVFKKNFWGFVAAVIIVAGLYMVMGYAGQLVYMSLIWVLFCWLIPLLVGPLYFYFMVIRYALFAEAYKQGAAE